MTFTENDVTFMLPDNVKNRSINEANEYLKLVQDQTSKELTTEQYEVLQNSFTAGYKTAFINLLQHFETCNKGVQ